jgi:hypothetical protein
MKAGNKEVCIGDKNPPRCCIFASAGDGKGGGWVTRFFSAAATDKDSRLVLAGAIGESVNRL